LIEQGVHATKKAGTAESIGREVPVRDISDVVGFESSLAIFGEPKASRTAITTNKEGIYLFAASRKTMSKGSRSMGVWMTSESSHQGCWANEFTKLLLKQ
jgi:hypothetical protein